MTRNCKSYFMSSLWHSKIFWKKLYSWKFSVKWTPKHIFKTTYIRKQLPLGDRLIKNSLQTKYYQWYIMDDMWKNLNVKCIYKYSLWGPVLWYIALSPWKWHQPPISELSLSPGCSTSDQLPSSALGKHCLVPCHLHGDSDGAPGSCLWLGVALLMASLGE